MTCSLQELRLLLEHNMHHCYLFMKSEQSVLLLYVYVYVYFFNEDINWKCPEHGIGNY